MSDDDFPVIEPTVRYCLVTGFECLTCEPGELCGLIFGEWSQPESVAIERLIEEVRNGNGTPNAYNRVYNRHNRS
jgi:hypothetical protein